MLLCVCAQVWYWWLADGEWTGKGARVIVSSSPLPRLAHGWTLHPLPRYAIAIQILRTASPWVQRWTVLVIPCPVLVISCPVLVNPCCFSLGGEPGPDLSSVQRSLPRHSGFSGCISDVALGPPSRPRPARTQATAQSTLLVSQCNTALS